MPELENKNYMDRDMTNLGNNVCIGWHILDNNKRNPHTIIRGNICKNNVIHYAMEFAKKCNHSDVELSQVIDNDIQSLLDKSASTGKKYCLVIRDSNIHMGQFLVKFNKWFNTKFNNEVLVGHLLDWKSQYYELHHQCFLIDVEWWIEAGKPSFAPDWSGKPWTATVLERSDTNFHAQERNHTPQWVKATDETATFNGHREGARVIASAAEHKKSMSPWPEELRNVRKYLYPELKKNNEHEEHMVDFDDLNDTNKYFAVNTERLYKDHMYEDYHAIVIPASGILNIIKPYTVGLNPGGHICVFDYSKIGIRYSQHVANWPGNCSLSEWIHNFKNQNYDYMIIGSDEEINNVDNYIKELGDDYTWWKSITWGTYSRDYQFINLLYFNNYKRLIDGVIRTLKERFVNDDNLKIYFNLTNIFHYPPTSIRHSLVERVTTINKIKEYNEQLKNKGIIVDLVFYTPLLKNSDSSIDSLPQNLKDIINYANY